MYNRYIPQPDGTYRRNRMQDPGRRPNPAPCQAQALLSDLLSQEDAQALVKALEDSQ